jgi:transposase
MALRGDAAGWARRGALETRHVRNAFKIMPVKTDRTDARGIAELMRLGWFRPVHCKSMEAQETRAMLTGRKLVQMELLETESSLRGILRGFGLKVGKTTPVAFEGRIRELVAGHPSLEVITSALLSVCAVLRRQFNEFERRPRAIARTDTRARLLTTTPSLGVIVAHHARSSRRRRGSRFERPHDGTTPRTVISRQVPAQPPRRQW